jgi:hypothetical protein
MYFYIKIVQNTQNNEVICHWVMQSERKESF